MKDMYQEPKKKIKEKERMAKHKQLKEFQKNDKGRKLSKEGLNEKDSM